MNVQLLSHTPNPEELVAMSAKLCYQSSSIGDIQKKLTNEEIERFVQHLVGIGHESPLEHIYFTFGIEGVSRSLSHQLVRHRIASPSQQSQRYVNMSHAEFIIPKEIEKNKEALDEFNRITSDIMKSYDKLVEIGILAEDARSILPNATETKLVLTMNARSLLNFFELRCCNRSQSEIKELSDNMLRLVSRVAPNVFKYAGASCMYGKCNEGSKSCGEKRLPSEYI